MITIEVDEPLIRVVIHFWDPSYRCFTFNGDDLVPTTEEYSMLIRLKLQCLDKVYYRRQARGLQEAHQNYEDRARRCGWLSSKQKREYRTRMGLLERFHQ